LNERSARVVSVTNIRIDRKKIADVKLKVQQSVDPMAAVVEQNPTLVVATEAMLSSTNENAVLLALG